MEFSQGGGSTTFLADDEEGSTKKWRKRKDGTYILNACVTPPLYKAKWMVLKIVGSVEKNEFQKTNISTFEPNFWYIWFSS